MGNVVPAAATQLRVDPTDPFRASGVRPAPPARGCQTAHYDTPVADKNILDALLGAPDVDHEGQGTDPPGSATDDPDQKGDHAP